MLFVYLATAWMAGIYLASLVALPLVVWGVIALLPLGIAWLWKENSRVRLAACCALFVALGAARYALALPRFDDSHVSKWNDRGWVTLTGVVVAEPDVRDIYANLRVQAETLSLSGQKPVRVHGLVLVRAPRYPELEYGDRLQVRGQLETPPVFETFSYRQYLARQGIHSLARWAKVETLERGQANPFLALILRFKRHTQRVIARILHEPYAALLTGILLGVESGLPADLNAAFQTTGTSHIIAISGFNIAIVAAAVSSVSVHLVGRRYTAWFSTAAIALYTLFVGAGAAVVRAALMGCVAVWGKHFGRQNSAPNALFFTALLMTLWNPNTLWDLGFLLSFAATLGLIVFADPFGRVFKGWLGKLLPPAWVDPATSLLNESLVLTACAQLTTLPIILYNFRTLSLVTLLSNLLVLPAQTQVMLWGAVATVAGLVWLPLGRLLGYVAWLFLAYTIGVVEMTARIPHAAIALGSVSPVFVWGWYAVLAGGSWLMVQSQEKRARIWQWINHNRTTRFLIGGAVVVALLSWIAFASLPDGKLHVTFLDVGQGDAVLVQTPDGAKILINGGPSATTLTSRLGKRLPFWDRTLDLVVLTDPADEHLAGLVAVLERYEVRALLHVPVDYPSPAYTRWAELLVEKGIQPQAPALGTRIELGEVALTVLHPADPLLSGTGDDVANNGIVLRLDYGQTCFLLTGGAQQEAEQAMLVRGENLRCDVLQVGDNGSQHASSAAFVQAVYPAVTVFSCAEDNRAACLDEQVLERFGQHGATILRTDQSGSIEFISDGAGYTVRTSR